MRFDQPSHWDLLVDPAWKKVSEEDTLNGTSNGSTEPTLLLKMSKERSACI